MTSTVSLLRIRIVQFFYIAMLIPCVLLWSACAESERGNEQIGKGDDKESLPSEVPANTMVNKHNAENSHAFGFVTLQWGSEHIEWKYCDAREMSIADDVVAIALQQEKDDGNTVALLLGITNKKSIETTSTPVSFPINYAQDTGERSAAFSLGSVTEQLHLQTGAIIINQLDIERGICEGEIKGTAGKVIVGDVESMKNFGEGKNLLPLTGSFSIKIDNIVDLRTKK